jgi:hypothetical protein
MPTREQLHEEVDAVPDELLDRVHLVLEPNGTGETNGAVNPIDDPLKDCVPMVGDTSDLASMTENMTEADREEQRAHWAKVSEELKAEGFEPDPKHLEELRRRAATWPE